MANCGRSHVDFIAELPLEVTENILMYVTFGEERPASALAALSLVNRNWDTVICHSKKMWHYIGREDGVLVISGRDTSHLAPNAKLLFKRLKRRMLGIDIGVLDEPKLTPVKEEIRLTGQWYKGMDMLAYDGGLIVAGRYTYWVNVLIDRSYY